MKKDLPTKRAEVKQFMALSLVLFIFWTILSGKVDTKHLIIGLISALTITWICRPLLRLPSQIKAGEIHFAFDLPYGKLFVYVLWLLKELVKANIEVALIVLNPRMPISPQIITFKKSMTNPVAHVVLANSITLTPGTITVDVQDDVYTIHALTESGALSLSPVDGEGEMPAHVGRLFKE
jgi:multicomponent Na+:H+ antiporter subunit E